MVSHVWEQFCARRKELLERIRQLESYLTAFPDLPCAPALYQEFHGCEVEIAKIKKEADKKRRVKVLAIDPRDLRRWRERNERLVTLRSLDAPELIIEKEISMIADSAQLSSIAALIKHDAETEGRYLPVQQRREAALAALEQEKLKIDEQLTNTQSELDRHEKDVISWAATDVEHLAFFMEADKHRAIQALDEFRRQHPGINIDHLTRLKAMPQKQYAHRALRDARAPEAPPANPVSVGCVCEELPWKFVMANDTATTFVELPPLEADAVDIIQDRMQAAEVRPVTAGLVLAKLRHATRLTAHERSRFKRSFDTPPIGWKLLRLGEYRIFLDINEVSRVITFLVRQRSNAYVMKGHTRSR